MTTQVTDEKLTNTYSEDDLLELFLSQISMDNGNSIAEIANGVQDTVFVEYIEDSVWHLSLDDEGCEEWESYDSEEILFFIGESLDSDIERLLSAFTNYTNLVIKKEDSTYTVSLER